MKQISKSILHTLFGLLSSLLVLILLLTLTSPYKLPLALLLLPSVVLGVVIFYAARLVQLSVSQGRSRIVPVSISVYGVLLSLLASLQQLTLKDSFLAAFLLFLGIFYYKRNIQS